jgi:SAM-dependent methyltransferase
VVASEQETAQRVCELLAERGRHELAAWSLAPDATPPVPELLIATGPSARQLWRPPRFLTDWAHLLPPPRAGGALDLACGSGRAAVWLAQRRYTVTAVDRLPEALDRGRRLAAGCGVRCRFVAADLRDLAKIPPGPWSVIVILRYLQRELLADLGRWLAPAGVAVIRTFREAAGFAGKPGPRYRLASGELPRYFPPERFSLLVHEENRDPDGRPAAGVVVRRL